MKNFLNRLARDQRGTLVLLFALLLIPMLGVLGLAVDYALLNRAKVSLDASNDEAVLAAATAALQTIQNQTAQTYDTSGAISLGQAVGANVFNADSSTTKIAHNASLTYNITLAVSGLKITATGTYVTQTGNVFGGIWGVPSSNVSGTSTATLTLPKYINIYIVADISQSMGIGATTADQNTLVKYTPDSCQFGCHVPETGYSGASNETIGHAHNATLRIDVVKQSIQNMNSQAYSSNGGSSRIQFALYTMDTSLTALTTPAGTLYPPDNGTGTVGAAATTIDLGSTPSNGTGPGDSYQTAAGTQTTSLLGNLVAQVKAAHPNYSSNDGSSPTNAQNFIFIMTDALYDYSCGQNYSNTTNPANPNITGHCVGPMDGSSTNGPCQTAKNANITVGFIYTTYIPILTPPTPPVTLDQRYSELVSPYYQTLDSSGNILTDQLAAAAKACASSGYYYPATSGNDIITAAKALFDQATSATALTQ